MRNISWRHFDFWLLGAVAFLTIFGVTMIRSAIAGNIELVEANTVIKQIIFAGIGLVILIIGVR
jgi:rod shape determining protein RodA